MLFTNKTLSILSASFLSATLSYAGGEGWIEDFEAAKKMADAEKKDLFIEFTGSDWCPPCKALTASVFSKDSFKTAAGKNYVLVELDFPNDKSAVTPEIAAQNKALMEKYAVKGFPTILLADAQGRPFGEASRRPGTPEAYVAYLEELQQNKVARDVEFAKAGTAEGTAKSEALFAGLQAVPEKHWVHYGEVIESIKTNDPEDESGFVAGEAKKMADAKAEGELSEKLGGLSDGINAAMGANDREKAFKIVDDFIASEGLEGARKQRATGIKFNVLRQMGENDIDALQKVTDELIAAEPDNEYSEQVRNYQNTQLKELREAQEKKEDAPVAAPEE